MKLSKRVQEEGAVLTRLIQAEAAGEGITLSASEVRALNRNGNETARKLIQAEYAAKYPTLS